MTDEETLALAESQAEICGVFGNANRVLILWALGDLGHPGQGCDRLG